MEPITIGIIGMLVMLAMIFSGVPIGMSLAAIGIGGNIILLGLPETGSLLYLTAWEAGTNFILTAIPLFIFMGQLVFHTGIATYLYDCVYKWFGRLPGGLAVTSVITATGFGAVTGSSLASVATMGAMVMPEMRKYRYNMALATGSLASAGTLAILIPPSVPLIIYGVWTETSIGSLFIAGILPGLLLSIGFCGMIMIRCQFNPELGPPGPRFSWGQRFASLGKLFPTLLIFLIVIGGIYGGIFTPSEAGATGSIGVLLVALFMKKLTFNAVRESLHQAGVISSVIFMILVGGIMLSKFLVQTDITPLLINSIGELDINRYWIILLLVIVYLILGAILDAFGMIILTLPLAFPLVTSLGFDPIWFGIFITIMIELALITPPIGLNVYVMQKVAPEVPLIEIFKGTVPFLIICLVGVFLLTLFPDLALWLPRTM